MTEILAYLDVIGVQEPNERADWVRLIRDMDREWLAFQAEKARASSSRRDRK